MEKLQLVSCSRHIAGRVVTVLVLFMGLCVCGCGSDPESEASNELRASCRQAAQIVRQSRAKARQILRESEESAKNAAPDRAVSELSEGTARARQAIKDGFARAYGQISTALSKHRRAADVQTVNVTLLAGADILFSQAHELHSLFGNYKAGSELIVDEITLSVRQVDSFESQKGVLEKLLEGVDSEAAGLEEVLASGVAGQAGLKSWLEAEQISLNELMQEKVRLEQSMSQQQKITNEIENRAGDMLKKAESLSGNAKLKMENDAYDLMLSKAPNLSKYQNIVDALSLVESKILISDTMVQKLKADVEKFQEQVAAIKSSSRQADLRSRLNQVNKQVSQHRRKIEVLFDELHSSRAAYAEAGEAVVNLFEKAAAEYAGAKSDRTREFAAERVASCRLWLGGVYSERMRFQEELLARMRNIKNTSAVKGLTGVERTMQECSSKSLEYRKKAFEQYDFSIEGFGALLDGQFSRSVVKSNILALYAKAELAEYLGDVAITDDARDSSYLISDKAVAEAEKLVPRAEEYDPEFSRSITAGLLAGDIDFVPQIPVDLAGYYENIKKQCGDWVSLTGRAKESRVHQILSTYKKMQPPDDPAAFERIIVPEIRLLEEAIKAGFAEEPQVAKRPKRPSDPNY